MFDKGTVFVLGAGASFDHGYPLGAQLKQEIVDLAFTVARGWKGRQGRKVYTAEEIGEIRHYIQRDTTLDKDISRDLNDHAIFANELNDEAPAETIDQFLMENIKWSAIGRFYIALVLLRRTYCIHPETHALEAEAQLTRGPANGGWYHTLVRALRDGCKDVNDLEQSNTLKVYTFNYDLSLEIYLENNLGSVQSFESIDYKKVVDIDHLYGTLPVLETGKHAGNLGHHLAKAASNNIDEIRIIGERTTDDQMKRIRGALSGAQQITIIGFGFDKENCRQLGLPEVLADCRLFLHNYDRESATHKGVQSQFDDWKPGRGATANGARGLFRTLDSMRTFDSKITESVREGLFRTS